MDGIGGELGLFDLGVHRIAVHRGLGLDAVGELVGVCCGEGRVAADVAGLVAAICRPGPSLVPLAAVIALRKSRSRARKPGVSALARFDEMTSARRCHRPRAWACTPNSGSGLSIMGLAPSLAWPEGLSKSRATQVQTRETAPWRRLR